MAPEQADGGSGRELNPHVSREAVSRETDSGSLSATYPIHLSHGPLSFFKSLSGFAESQKRCFT